MAKAQRHYLRLFHGLEHLDSGGLLDTFSTPYNETLRYGFSNTESVGQSLFSTLIYQVIARQRAFDPLSGTLTMEDRVIFEQVPFEIDQRNGLLLVQRGGRRLAKLASILHEVFGSEITITDVQLDIPLLIEQIKYSGWNCFIKAVSVRSFRPVTGLSGDFDADVSEQAAAHWLIQSYKTDVTKVCLDLVIEDSSANMIFSNTGVVALRTEDDYLETWTNHARSLILRCRYA